MVKQMENVGCSLCIPAHVGVEGNEEMDITKQALKHPYVEMDLSISKA
jgi:hypothetical protein